MAFKDGNFDMSDKKGENRPRKVEDHEALLDEDDRRKKMLADKLDVIQHVISMHLRTMRKDQKIGKWVLHELSDRQIERSQNTAIHHHIVLAL